MDSIEFCPAQRRKLLLWVWGSVLLAVTGIVGIVLAPHLPDESTSLLVLPGLVGLILAPLTLNIGYGRTVPSQRGLRTSKLFSQHVCGWPAVAVIDTKTTRGGKGRATPGSSYSSPRADPSRWPLPSTRTTATILTS